MTAIKSDKFDNPAVQSISESNVMSVYQVVTLLLILVIGEESNFEE